MNAKFLASTALLAGFLFAGGAQAYVVTDNPDNLPPPGTFALDCGGNCVGLGSTLGSSYARAYDVQPANEAAELAKLNELVGGGVTYVFKPSPEITGPTASTFREYFSIKIGNQTTFYQNLLTDGTLTFTFKSLGRDGETWAAKGFSHLTEYGDPVPLPGAVWLFGSALVGLVTLNRRRRLAA